jgi:hypothetical protein
LQTAGVMIGNKISANISLQNEKGCQQESSSGTGQVLLLVRRRSFH